MDRLYLRPLLLNYTTKKQAIYHNNELIYQNLREKRIWMVFVTLSYFFPNLINFFHEDLNRQSKCGGLAIIVIWFHLSMLAIGYWLQMIFNYSYHPTYVRRHLIVSIQVFKIQESYFYIRRLIIARLLPGYFRFFKANLFQYTLNNNPFGAWSKRHFIFHFT